MVTAAVADEERAVAAEAITCAVAGNTVLIASNQARTAREIAEIVDLVAFELDAEVGITVRGGRVEIKAPYRHVHAERASAQR